MNKIKTTLFATLIMAAGTICAQSKQFTIHGEMSCDSLRFSPQKIEKLYLVYNKDGVETIIDSATVENKCFTFKGAVPKEIETYNITGFDNGGIQVFIEEGEITISPFDARFPVSAHIGGTPCNDIMQQYVDINNKSIKEGTQRMKEMFDNLPREINDNPEARQKAQTSIFYSNNLYTKAAIIDFVHKNIESPVALYIIKYNIFPAFTPKAIEQQFLRAVPKNLHSHKMYKELVNQVRAAELKEGKPAPNIVGTTPDGKEVHLSDFAGKYILLDFWASWCAPCRREFPHIKEALAYSEKSDNFVVLSYSIDSKEEDWKNCITKNELTHKNWIHISTLKGWNSEAAKLFNVQGVPHTVLLNPNGEVVQFELRGEAMVKKIKRIADESNKNK